MTPNREPGHYATNLATGEKIPMPAPCDVDTSSVQLEDDGWIGFCFTHQVWEPCADPEDDEAELEELLDDEF